MLCMLCPVVVLVCVFVDRANCQIASINDEPVERCERISNEFDWRMELMKLPSECGHKIQSGLAPQI